MYSSILDGKKVALNQSDLLYNRGRGEKEETTADQLLPLCSNPQPTPPTPTGSQSKQAPPSR